jgi:hypothetical protein
MSTITKLLETRFGGSFRMGPITFYGFNAMHVAVNIRTRRWGTICFHPTIRCFGVWWPWYLYLSPNATPWAATFAIGKGVEATDRAKAIVRRTWFGHGFDVEKHREHLMQINQAL